jgi:MFS transporter, Spinster family, sphingosine-1-phosphate transporter
MKAHTGSGKDTQRMKLRGAWFLVLLMWFAYFLNYCDRQVIFSIFPVLRRELHFTEIQLGLTGAVFLWVYGLSSPIAGELGDRYSKRTIVWVSLLLWSVSTMLTGIARSPAEILFFRGMTGITEALFVPAAVVITASAFGPRRRSLAISALLTGQMVGGVAGGWYGGYVAQMFGWRLAFFSLGAVGLVYAIPYVLYLRNAEEAPVEKSPVSNRLAVLDLARVPTFVALCFCFPFYMALTWLLYAWLPDFLYEGFSLSLAQAGFTATVYLQTAIFVGMLAGGGLGDRLYQRVRSGRFWMLCGAMLFTAPWISLLGHADSLRLEKLAMVGAGLGFGLFMANFVACPFDVVPASARASAIGITNTIGPPVSGAMVLFGGTVKRTYGIGGAMNAAALIAAASGLILMVAVTKYFARDHALLCTREDLSAEAIR